VTVACHCLRPLRSAGDRIDALRKLARPSCPRSELLRWRDAALAICDDADRMALAGFRRDIVVDTKPDRTFVTEVDRSIEHHGSPSPSGGLPWLRVRREEEGTEGAGAAVLWYIDPIDATANFVRGISVFATLLAVAVRR